ncbi:hypothetical protein [Vibrio agarivorans]|uniref:Lipoprotein n=1 Tax=Vibrio agarivorans TaxID=153622 RepID=A0ABT7Y4B1_9VIBR|nr:hypothetical protein [Vibrio agarivorans]MDN2482837.1 hypothetical protein [Vibrio agarivorans]
MKKNTIATLLVSSLILTGCGSDSNSPSSPEPIDSISGLASYGGAIKGEVTFNVGALSASEWDGEIKVFDSGEFEIENASEFVYPVLLRIEGTRGIQSTSEYSILFDDSESRINLSPLTRLVIGRVAQVDADVVFDNFEAYQSKFTRQAIAEAQMELVQIIKPLLDAANIEQDIDLFTSSYLADFRHLDSVLSTLDVKYKSGEATITYAPNVSYSVILPYDESWQGLSLVPSDSDGEKLSQDLSVIHSAKQILEAMILLKDDKEQFESFLSPQAHWFGQSADMLHESYFDVLPAEKDPTISRYRDLVILDSVPEEQRYLLGYTTAFEASTVSSVARDQAWFEYVDGELKFLGDDQPFPTSFYALYKLNYAPDDYGWTGQKEFSWVFETTGFLSKSHCTVDLDRGEWRWSSPEFMESLPDLSDVFEGLQYVSITLPSQQTVKLNKIYRDPSDENCHLVDEINVLSPLLDGYHINLNTMEISENQSYTATFVYDDAVLNKVIQLTQPPEHEPMMLDYVAELVEVDGRKDTFYYDWERESDFVVEGDLYVYFPEHVGVGHRINIEAGKTEVSEKTNADVNRIFHSAFDPYGRVITNYYIGKGQEPLN